MEWINSEMEFNKTRPSYSVSCDCKNGNKVVKKSC